MDVDIIIAPASTEVEPARQATKTIPIVFTQHADPVGIGHVATLHNLARVLREQGNVAEMWALYKRAWAQRKELWAQGKGNA